MTGKIFINYRRGDDPSAAQALFARLEQAFSPAQLFMDVDNIEPGFDFVRVVTEQIAACDVLISVIGKNWIDARDDRGARRLDNPSDFVRIEIESALQQDKRVIPVLVGQAQMPSAEQLPDTMKPLATRNAVRLTHERFRADTQGLIAGLQRALESTEEARTAQAQAAVARRASGDVGEREDIGSSQIEEARTKAEGQAPWRAEEERRQVTILFADMVGFTGFSERAGEEAAFKLMRSLSDLMDEAVRENSGTMQVFTGDGIMAVFGAPVAYEDAPLRACQAALAVQRKLKSAGPDLAVKHGLTPQLRIGLNTGAVVVGAVQRGADAGVTVLGDTVNLASRLQALAEPDAVLMSETTHRLVQGLVEARFVGEHQVKGKSEPQKVYRLHGIRQGATRFEAAVSRGLSSFVGRERELEMLEREVVAARAELHVIDVLAEPGIGKSRLLYEFRRRIGEDGPFVLSANCSPDGQQTAFLPFIEVVRGSFRLSAGEAEKHVAQKLELGLSGLGLNSQRNLGLLLHLLGLQAPESALTGLDGVLIGLRTRDLLQQVLEARCKLSPVVLLIEDLHWLDSVSAELLGKFINGKAELRLLILTTRRPEFRPPWLGRQSVTTLELEPLPTGDIRRLVQTRIGIQALPDALARQLAEKAEGNPLFAEEIVSFLIERGIVRTTGGKLDFDGAAVAAALPASVQSLLAARVGRLATQDRALLQAAAVIGRQFDPELLAAVTGETAVDARLTTIEGLDLIHSKRKSSDFVFKHALVRDALYQSLLSDPRKLLHQKIAAEIERRSGNRLVEVAEMLAHHYSQTDDAGNAFVYLSMAGAKSLSVYSLDHATNYFTAGLTLLDKTPNFASDHQIADFFVSYARLLNMTLQIKTSIAVLGRYLPRIDSLGDDPRVVMIRHYFVFALVSNARYRDASVVQRETSRIADRLEDSASKAYSLAGDIHVSTVFAPKPLDEFESLKINAIRVAAGTTDAYIQNWTRFVIGWEEFHRGRITEAFSSARELMRVGQMLKDPRSTGQGLALMTWIALASNSYAEAVEYCEQSLAVAVTPFERNIATAAKGCALVLLRRPEEGLKLLDEQRRLAVTDGNLVIVISIDAAIALGKALQGSIREGIHSLEHAILRIEEEGYRDAADWCRLFLCELYVEVVAGTKRPSLLTVLKNLSIILKIHATAGAQIPALMKSMLQNSHQYSAGHHVGRAHMILGLFYQAKKKQPLALEHLSVAERILSQFGQTPILARVETALAELR